MKYKDWGMMKLSASIRNISKPILDELEWVLARHYWFTEEEAGLHH